MRPHEFKVRRLRRPNPHKLGLLPLARRIPALKFLAIMLAMVMGLGILSLSSMLKLENRFADAGNYYNQTERPVFELCNTEREMPSVANLSRDLTINGTTYSPTIWYKAQDTSGGVWTGEYGASLSEAGSGSSPSYDQGSPLMGSDTSVKGNAGKYPQAAAATTGDIINGNDWVIEWCGKVVVGASLPIASKRVNDAGWQLYVTTAPAVTFIVEDSLGVTDTISATVVDGAWYHIVVVGDESGFMRIFANGVSKSTSSLSATNGNFSSSEKLTLFARADGTQDWTGSTGHLAEWQGFEWLDTDNQAALVAERFRTLTGFRPQISADTSVPLTYQRNSLATIEKYDEATSSTELYTVGENWLRCSRWLSTGGSVVTGYNPEETRTNECRQSRTLATTPWVAIGAATATNNTTETTGPWGDYTASKVTGIGTLAVDDLKNSITTFSAPGVVVAHAVWIKRISTSGTLNIVNAGGNPLKGSWTIDMSALPDKWVRLTKDSSYVTVVNPFITGASNNAGPRFAATAGGPLSFYVGNCTAEEASCASSDIITTTGAVQRLKDELEYTITGPGAQGAIVVDYMIKSCDIVTGFDVVDVSDGTSTNIARHKLTTGDVQQSVIGATGSVVCTTVMSDGVIRRTGTTWKAGLLQSWVNGSKEGTDDKSVTAPAAMTQANIGMQWNNIGQPSVPTLIRRIRIYRRYQYDMDIQTRIAA